VGPQIQVPNNLVFGDTCGGSTSTETLEVCNVGTENLVVHSITASDPQFSVTEPSAGFPVDISPDFCFPFEASFTPTGAGPQAATLTITSNDPANSTVTVQATGMGAEADINVTMVDAGQYGNVCLGDLSDLNLQILNQGACNLEISDIDSSNPTEFVLPDNLQFPLVLSPDANVNVPIRFQPDTALACSDSGTRTADITISSDDPDEPTVVQGVSGQVPCPVASTSGELNFGQLCIGDSRTQTVDICDTGPCNMSVTGAELIGPDCDDLTLVSPDPPPTPDDPLVISPDFCFGFVVRFEPDDLIPPTCNLEITTDDPDNPTLVFPVYATMGEPDINVSLVNAGYFGDVCLGDFSDLNLQIVNQGTCNLDISSITSSNPEFVLPDDLQFPLVLSPDANVDVPIRFEPDPALTCSDDIPRTSVITIVSNDVDEPIVELEISGIVPCPDLVLDPPDLYGIYAFPPTVTDPEGDLGCFSDRNLVIRNLGACPALITDISMVADPDSFEVIAPTVFPITFQPGEETLDVTVRFAPETGGGEIDMPEETIGTLIVESDDPDGSLTGGVCGEAVVQSGGRWLVIDGSDIPLDNVGQMTLMSKGINQPQPVLIRLKNAPLLEFEICGNMIRYHLSREDLPPTETSGSNPNSSYTIRAKEGNKQAKKSFTLGPCEFKVDIIKLK
jgi:hypothetical protein